MTRFPSCILLCLATWLVVPPASTAQTKPNVLLIAVDDLNDWVGCLAGHPDTQTPKLGMKPAQSKREIKQPD